MSSSKIDDYYWTEKFQWEGTSRRHVWKCVTTGKYHFNDEAEQIDKTPYDSLEECEKALNHYVATYL